MNIKVLRKEIEFVGRMVENKTTIPILAHALISQHKRAMTITGTDLECAAVSAFSNNAAAMDITVSPKEMLKILAKREGDVTLKRDEDKSEGLRLAIENGAFSASLQAMAKDSYPEIPQMPTEGHVKLPATVVEDMLTATKHAISEEESRFTLNGSLFWLYKGKLKVISTDGHRLAIAEHGPFVGDYKSNPDVKFLVRSRISDTFGGVAEIGGDVEIVRDENHVWFKGQGPNGIRVLMARVLEGSFPDYERVMPKPENFKFTADITRKPFLELVSRMKAMAKERGFIGSLNFKSSVGESSVTVAIGGDQRAEEKLGAMMGKLGVNFKIGLNLSYLEQSLKAFTCETVKFSGQTPESAMQLDGTVGEGISLVEVLMPVRI